jgi:hypothetical protein
METYLEICDLPRLCANLVLRHFALGLVFVEIQKRIVQRLLQFVRAGLFFLELFVEVAVVALEEALADSQLPDFLVTCDNFN